MICAEDDLRDKVTRVLLPQVRNPAQYIGGEVNQVRKEYHAGDIRVALAFPDTYAIGMSHLGLAILYQVLNEREHIVAERVFCPWLDAAEVMRREGIPLFSWETRRAVRSFDILGITLQHELCYSNVLYLLDLAQITFRAEQRRDEEPLVIGGGPMADCCEPVADFFDLVILGDGEESVPAVVESIRLLKRQRSTRRDILLAMARQYPFVYVPQFYRCEYGPAGRLAACEPMEEGIANCVQRAMVTDLEQAVFPVAPLMAHTDTPHNRIALEIMRGCPQRCAFCHAGHTKGKLRRRSVEKIVELAWKSYRNTGHDTISLLSLSTSDYPQLRLLLEKLYQRFEGLHVGISLPSLRVDKQLHEVPSQVVGVRREGLTVAVETANDTIRRAIGKKVTDVDLMATLQAAFEAGWRKVKLYFMVGFPGETEDDIMQILALSGRISQLRREICGQPAVVTASISWLVPKPHTPLEWIPQQTVEYFRHAKEILLAGKKQLRGAAVKLKFHHLERSFLEGVLARGDRRLSYVIEEAYKSGARFDDWDENFEIDRYISVFEKTNTQPSEYAHRQREENEKFPWDHLAGDNRKSLFARYLRFRECLGI